MRYSRIFSKTSKTAPADDSINAKLLTQGGFILKQMAGVYNFLPLGLKVLQKIQNIVREEMNATGSNEILMPALTQQENYIATGREGIDVLFHLKGHGDADYVLNQSHEEVVTPLVQKFVASYRDLPVSVYQIQNKFRNEARAKSGILRGREFNMKDMYSFHVSQEDLDAYYEKVQEAYFNVYRRLGLGDHTVLTFASGGSFSKYSHEFQALSDVGEDVVFFSKSENIYYNREIAPSQAPKIVETDTEMKPMEHVKREGVIGVEDLCKALNVPVEKTTKTLLYETDTGEVVAVAVRGDYQVNELKLIDILGCKSVNLASEETVLRVTGAKVGYAGMLNLPENVRQIWDESNDNRLNFEMGANQTDHHTMNVNFGRDLPHPEKFYDVKIAKEGDIDPKTGEVFPTYRAIEVGNIFKLGNRFSQAFDFFYADSNGEKKPIIMGCYGIGPSRLMGTIVELFHDERGIIWPSNVAPYQVHLTYLGTQENVKKEAERLYNELVSHNIEVLFDDRDVSAGEKLADADLIGNPIRLLVSEKTLAAGGIEYKKRNEKETQIVPFDQLMTLLK